MEFKNVYKSRSVILDMLRLRNCDVSSFEGQTRDELNILYQQHGAKGNSEVDTLDIIVPRNAPETYTPDSEDVQLKSYKVMIKYLISNKVRNQNIINCIEEIYEQEVLEKGDVLVIVTKDKVTYQGALEEFINRIFYKDGTFVQILWLNNLLFDISKHDLVPDYRIMTTKEKDELIGKLYLESEDKLPFVQVTDPVARFYGVRIGQVCEIIYNNETNGKNKFYRLCVAN